MTSGLMQVLLKLIDTKIVKLYLPEIVKREFCTKRIDETRKNLKGALSALKNTRKKINEKSEIQQKLEHAETEIRESLSSLELVVEEEFSNWEKRFKVELLPFPSEDISIVLDDYFSGTGAFSSLKNRADIPDSMIQVSICKLMDNVDKVYLVINDRNFRNCMDKYPNTETFTSLSELLELFTEEKILDHSHLKDYLEGKIFSKALKNHMKAQKKTISEIYITNESIINTELIGVKLINAEISCPESSDIRDLTIKNSYSISDGLFTAEIAFSSTASIHMITDYGSYHELKEDKSRDVDIDSINSDGIVDAYEAYNVRFSGNIELSFNEAHNFGEISKIVDRLHENNSNFNVSLNIESAELLNNIP